MIVIGDTSALVAAFDTTHSEHENARTALSAASLTVVCSLVLLEIEHIVTRDFDRETVGALHDWLLAQELVGRVAVPALPSDHLRKARRVQDRYTDLRLDFTDAVNVVLAAEYETDVILTLDRKDFRAVRPLTGEQGFRVLPDDL